MDFSFSSDQLEIRDSMARIFKDYCSDDALKQLSQSPMFFHQQLWQEVGAAGILGLPFAGEGIGFPELCQILELQGESVAPLPIVPSIVEVAMTLNNIGGSEQIQAMVDSAVAGEKILTTASPYHGLQEATPLSANVNTEAITLEGRSGFVPYAELAAAALVNCVDQDGQNLLVFCELTDESIEVVPQLAINDEPAGFLNFNATKVSEHNIIARGAEAQQLLTAQRQRAWVASAAIVVGALDEGLKRTAAYVSERKQFGRVLGSFQAVSQQAADAYMELESLRSVYWRALEDFETDKFQTSAGVVKFWTVEAAHKVAHAILHLHGGIGQDLDYPIHRFFLFAKQFERYLGTADEVALELGEQLLQAQPERVEQLCQ